MNSQNDSGTAPFLLTHGEQEFILKLRELPEEEQQEIYRTLIDSALRNLQK